ncbi:MAG: CBS domain-containing protein, partial [Bacteroidetes bacterium 4572_112]
SIDVTIKLSGENIDAIIQTFERYNYKIKYSFNSNKESVSKIEENYQSLMSYLNV